MVTTEEVMEVLRRVGNGQVQPTLKTQGQGWKEVYAGNVVYMVDGWEIAIFNDCDSFDYIDSVVAPDGRTGEYEDWFVDVEGKRHQESRQPDDVLRMEDPGCAEKMEAVFIATE